MEQYIPKSVVVAEIERLITPECSYSMNKLIDFINTLEVKEMDLSKYINKYFKGWYVDLTDKEKIRKKVEKLKSQLLRGACSSQIAMETRCKEESYNEVLAILDTMKEEPVSEELEDAASSFARKDSEGISNPADFYYTVADKARIFKAGAEWQKQKDSIPISKELEDFAKRQADEFAEREYEVDSYDRDYLSKGYYWGCKDGAKWQKENLWKPADGDDLPEIDREVIALLDNGKVVFAHRPPEFWDGKNIITGKVTRNYVERYDKGLWNIPNVKYWLDVNLPKQED